ncbi:MAG TPA: hypothetical protein VFU98_01605 [Microlunatus sp.]|nr:hypothetical protein [Microlunatus sp.]
MITLHFRRLALLLPIVLFLLLGSTTAASTSPRAVELRAIGHPTWRPVDCHVFAGRIGLPPTYDEYFATVGAVLPEPKHRFHPELGIGPGVAHRPPYRSELAKGLAVSGLHQGRIFRTREFSSGSAVIAGCMMVPAPGSRGSSPDFRSGRIISNTLFPIHAEGIAYRNGAPFDPHLIDYDVPALTSALEPPFRVDGHSHFPFFVATNDSFGPDGVDLRGAYRYDYTLVDRTGAGWHIKARFLVVR